MRRWPWSSRRGRNGGNQPLYALNWTRLSCHRFAANEPALLRSLWLEIDVLTAAEGEFASACRQFVASQMAERGLTRP